MAHFTALVLVPADTTDITAAVRRLLAPYEEDGEHHERTRWDGWQIGGRSTGLLDSSYEPDEDPANLERCQLCNGTGRRPHGPAFGPESASATHSCDRCHGTGKALKPTEWVPFTGDIQPVRSVDLDYLDYLECLPLSVVTPDGEWHEEIDVLLLAVPREGQEPEDAWRVEVRRLFAENEDALVVVVDCHFD